MEIKLSENTQRKLSLILQHESNALQKVNQAQEELNKVRTHRQDLIETILHYEKVDLKSVPANAIMQLTPTSLLFVTPEAETK